MDIKVKSDVKNELMARREIECYVTSDGATPKVKDVGVGLCKMLNLNPNSTIIVKLQQPFGVRRSIAYAHSYDSEEAMRRYEPKHLIERYSKRNAEKAQEAES
ncbi:MAG: 30S ribosomal protein S24e [Candidatus Marsarchaeota archaeon]|jgi:ribosomal protein S24E|nr:30S ribosomal protein S24e [Candidatus Marsarchaeota archaeon]